MQSCLRQVHRQHATLFSLQLRSSTTSALCIIQLQRMISILRLEEPSGLEETTIDQARWCLPFSYEVGEQRRGGRELYARYKRRDDDPADLSGPGPLQWISRTRAAAAAATAKIAARNGAPYIPDTSSLVDHNHRFAIPNGADAPPPPPAPAERPPSDSHLELLFPFSRSPGLREQYQRFTSDRMRTGLVLEDLDTLAGDIAARHAGIDNRVVLTASIDRISWLQDPSVGDVTMAHDLRMAGQVVWAGRSSMEVMIELSVRKPGPPGSSQEFAQWHFIGVAFFVLVARTPDRTAGQDVPLLVPQTEREKALFQQGKAHMQQRQRRREAHWARRPPTTHEMALVHDLIRNHYAHRSAAQHRGSGEMQIVPMKHTSLQKSCLMHSQDRNVFDVIFGGHLLRLAYEHAFATAALHAGEYCDPVSMDDVAFLMPVPIGALLRLSGQVVYAEGAVVRVHIRAAKLEPGAPEQSIVTNTFSFAFRCPSGPVRGVVPETMVEAFEYVMAYRQHAKDQATQAGAGAGLQQAADPAPMSKL